MFVPAQRIGREQAFQRTPAAAIRCLPPFLPPTRVPSPHSLGFVPGRN